MGAGLERDVERGASGPRAGPGQSRAFGMGPPGGGVPSFTDHASLPHHHRPRFGLGPRQVIVVVEHRRRWRNGRSRRARTSAATQKGQEAPGQDQFGFFANDMAAQWQNGMLVHFRYDVDPTKLLNVAEGSTAAARFLEGRRVSDPIRCTKERMIHEMS